MSYFVTGGTGFIGQNLIRQLLGRRGKVYVLVRPSSLARLEQISHHLDLRSVAVADATAFPLVEAR